MTKRMTITLDDGLYSMVRIKHRNSSKYLQELIKADVYKVDEQKIYDAIVKRQKSDGYITEDITPEMWEVLKQLATTQTSAPIFAIGYQTDFQRAKANAALSEPTIVPDSQEYR